MQGLAGNRSADQQPMDPPIVASGAASPSPTVASGAASPSVAQGNPPALSDEQRRAGQALVDSQAQQAQAQQTQRDQLAQMMQSAIATAVNQARTGMLADISSAFPQGQAQQAQQAGQAQADAAQQAQALQQGQAVQVGQAATAQQAQQAQQARTAAAQAEAQVQEQARLQAQAAMSVQATERQQAAAAADAAFEHARALQAAADRLVAPLPGGLPPVVVSQELGDRSLDDLGAPNTQRLRGVQRNPRRLQQVRREFQAQGRTLSEADVTIFASLLDQGAQVGPLPSPPTRSGLSGLSGLLGGVAGSGQGQQASLLDDFRSAGLAEVLPEDKVSHVVRDFLRKETEQKGDFKPPASYKEFTTLLRKSGRATRDSLDANPERFWDIEWIRQSVEYLHDEFNWKVAGAYFQALMKEWQGGWLTPSDYASSEFFRQGHILGALHQQCYHTALFVGGARAAPDKTGGTGSTSGSATKHSPTDQWCGWHKRFYPRELNHWWDTARKEGSCHAAKSAGKKG